MKKLVTIDEAVFSKKQHNRPCSDCPWARASVRGWTGSVEPEYWVRAAHGETKVLCHVILGPQCAGAAIYRSNVAKSPRDASLLVLPANRALVFASPIEFLNHHQAAGVGSPHSLEVPHVPSSKSELDCRPRRRPRARRNGPGL